MTWRDTACHLTVNFQNGERFSLLKTSFKKTSLLVSINASYMNFLGYYAK